MKMKQTVFFTLLIGAVALSSCEKNLYDENKQPEKEHNVANLDIPANFDWKMTKGVDCTVTSGTDTRVSLYLDENCSESELIASFPVSAEAATLPLSLPTYSKVLYLQYETTEGQKAVKALSVDENGKINVTLPANTKTMAQTRGDIKPTNGMVWYPKDGWGTIMFEDLFPAIGDYDFNDFVMNYKVQLYDVVQTGKGNDKKYTTSIMLLGVQLKAIGGSLPYHPYLRIHGLKRDNIASIEIEEKSNTEMENVKFINGKDGETILDLSELAQSIRRPSGSSFYNTEKDYAIESDKLPKISIYIELKESTEIKGNLEDEDFEFYLANEKDGTEIHLNGYEPVAYTYPVTNSNLLPLNGNIDNYYYSAKRLIWGLKVPASISHAIEKANFLDAYKNFEKWATSGGQNASNWYDQGNRDKDLLMNDK